MDMASEFCHGKKNGGFTATVLLCKTSYTYNISSWQFKCFKKFCIRF